MSVLKPLSRHFCTISVNLSSNAFCVFELSFSIESSIYDTHTPRISSSLSGVSAVAFDDKAAILLISFCFFGGFSLVNELMQITLNIAITDTIIGTIFLFFNQIILWSSHGNFHHIHLHHQPDINYRNSL